MIHKLFVCIVWFDALKKVCTVLKKTIYREKRCKKKVLGRVASVTGH